MSSRPFRFGVNILSSPSRSEWQVLARKAEDLGYDILNVPDHMSMQSPFAALVTAAEGSCLALGTYVVNTGLYQPAMLAHILAPDLSEHELLALPTVLVGSEQQIAETILSYRKKHGITYFVVLETDMDAFSQVIHLLR
jgi:alkanesulfonate monooxygenase SsuD/methylene tetrahydromethanopterin reductase-like flavin-dependent oxidoreductase (luciferase family)